MYNYEFYVLVYQSIPDVCVILTDEVFALGIPYRDCNLGSICSNRYVKEAKLDKLIKNIDAVSSRHKTAKNLLLHQGIRLKSHPGMSFNTLINDKSFLTTLAQASGTDIPHARISFQNYVSQLESKSLIPTLQKEIVDIEHEVTLLFNELLPYYEKLRLIHSKK